ncbi:Hypothetical predicted protein [Xyrichtys novacula]|uniref:Uncharacterized protein n=1 Tax=Xyrichtys novacula TaxID=13765 RepID=A0AAV1FQT1_XYRNO|nr:Hypothetical predicted protein [Xyrichtys novacula]
MRGMLKAGLAVGRQSGRRLLIRIRQAGNGLQALITELKTDHSESMIGCSEASPPLLLDENSSSQNEDMGKIMEWAADVELFNPNRGGKSECSGF